MVFPYMMHARVVILSNWYVSCLSSNENVNNFVHPLSFYIFTFHANSRVINRKQTTKFPIKNIPKENNFRLDGTLVD